MGKIPVPSEIITKRSQNRYSLYTKDRYDGFRTGIEVMDMNSYLKKLLIIGMLIGSFVLSGTGVLGSAINTVEADVSDDFREVCQMVESPSDVMHIYELIAETGSCAGSVADVFERTLRIKREIDQSHEIQSIAEARKLDVRLL